jgi:hypothetical protein
MTIEELRDTIEMVSESLENLQRINETYIGQRSSNPLTEEDSLEVGEILLDLEKKIY